MTSRRQFIAAASALPLARAAFAADAAVLIGVQTYSFHHILNDGRNHAAEIIAAMRACGVSNCELFSPQIEPGTFVGKTPSATECAKPFLGCPPAKGGSMRNPWSWEFRRLEGKAKDEARAKQKQWRETVPLDYFMAIRKQFTEAGATIYSYNPLDLDINSSDIEVDRMFQMTKALGAKAMNISTTASMLKRMVPFAEKHQIIVAPHGHSETWNPEQFSTRATFEKAFALSKWVGANLDIGHYAAGGGDPVAFIEAHHDRITNLHIKDRQRNKSAKEEDGANVPWGQGDTPIRPVLQLLKKKGCKIPAFIEYEHAGTGGPVDEVKRCLDFCRKALA
jgi:sugar phosphate isomerase/epimerase